jgi:hypothetical protein
LPNAPEIGKNNKPKTTTTLMFETTPKNTHWVDADERKRWRSSLIGGLLIIFFLLLFLLFLGDANSATVGVGVRSQNRGHRSKSN